MSVYLSNNNKFKIIFAVIDEVIRGNIIQSALNKFLKDIKKKTEKGKITDIVYGYFRYKIKLDFIISQFIKIKKNFPKECLILLEVAIYRFLYQKEVSTYALVDSLVEYVKGKYGIKISRVVNAVLRNFIRDIDIYSKQEEFEKYCNEKLIDYDKINSVLLSTPLPLIKLISKQYAPHIRKSILKSYTLEGFKGIRINPYYENYESLIKELNINEKFRKIAENFYIPRVKEKFDKLLGIDVQAIYEEGGISWQAPGSILLLQELGIFDWEEAIWDACGGVGGKSLALYERKKNVDLVTDKNFKRLNQFVKDCKRLKFALPFVVVCDNLNSPIRKWEGNILLDVPCSGLGVINRRPDIKLKNFTKTYFLNLAKLQFNLTSKMISFLKPGFRLAYITCTINKNENEEIIKQVLNTHKNMRLIKEYKFFRGSNNFEFMYGAVIQKRILSR